MFELGTKAETLEQLRTHITKGKICPSIIFTVDEWHKRSSPLIDQIRKDFGGEKVVVRSSAFNEDCELATNAGTHESVLNVPANSRQSLKQAVAKVIDSYRKTAQTVNTQSQVLVQPMVNEVSMSGVIFTQDLNTGGPYYVINYDDVSGKTDAVTSGIGDTSRTLLIYHGSNQNIKSPRFRTLMEVVCEIEASIDSPGLDIEFAVTKSEEVYIFQVRRLAVQKNWNRETSRCVDINLNQIRVFLKSRFAPAEGVLGSQSVYGVMPDWNPIEMIGSAPRRLAMSLYRYLITDSVWAEARAEMGYRDLSFRPLMVNLGGRVYVDVRESFNSFLPASLPDDIGEKLVTHWLHKLIKHPELHDKVEFEVACTVYPIDFDENLRPGLQGEVLTVKEVDQFADCLLEMTNKIIGGQPDIIEMQFNLIRNLTFRRAVAFERFAGEDSDRFLELSRSLLNDCRVFGTKPFSILARCAFIGEQFMRSLTRMGMISPEFASAFRQSIKTVLSDFLIAVNAVYAGEISESEFEREYGHLRPGTYDILSKRYDQRDYFHKTNRHEDILKLGEKSTDDIYPSPAEEERIDRLLKEKGYHFKCSRLFQFIRKAITGREYAKFKFTHNLSDALELIANWGAMTGLSRNELSHIFIWDLFDILQETSFVRVEDHFRNLAKNGREAHRISRAIRLPFLITSVSDVDVVPLLKCRPNFVTQRCIRGRSLLITGQELEPQNIDGHIVLIESADPGYDWIFMNRILGLVTKYGGANSHMAIRCAELDIPAAIGCGEQLFESAVSGSELSLDCGAELIIPIK